MSKRRGRSQAPAEPLSPEALDAYINLGGQLAEQMAEGVFRRITVNPAWLVEDVDAATEQALGRMDVTARDLHAARGLDPDGAEWAEVWGGMERRYRERMDELLREAGPRGRGTAQ